MSGAPRKTYKNINTILEKVKRGEIATGQKRLFQNVDYHKRLELIKPYVHHLDQQGIHRSIKNFVESDGPNTKIIDETFAQFNSSVKDLNKNELRRSMTEIYNKLPKELTYDLFNQYYTSSQKLKYEDRSGGNKQRFRMIDKANDPVLKLITNDHPLKSMVFTRHMMQYFLMMLAIMKAKDPLEFEKFMQQLKSGDAGDGGQSNEEGQGEGKSGQGSGQSQPQSGTGKGQTGDPNETNDQSDPQDGEGDGTQSQEPSSGNSTAKSKQHSGGSGTGNTNPGSLDKQLADIMDKFLEKSGKGTEKLLDQAMNQAKETIKMLEENMSDEDMKEMWEDISSGSVQEQQKAMQKTDQNYLTKIYNELKTIGMNMSTMKQQIKHLLDKSVSYFSARDEIHFENFMDNPAIEAVLDIELLHPKMRAFSIEDVLVKETEKVGKISVYVDVSGSMASSAKLDSGISKLTFAKAMVLKLKEMNMLNDVYSFESNVKRRGNKVTDILTLDGGGGTCLETVIQHVKKIGENALIITDAEDHLSTYSDLAFFIGVAGSRFTSFRPECMAKYADKNQVIVFDGKGIRKVGRNGEYKK